MVGLSTVYKVLELLKQKSLVNEIEGEARFDAHTDYHINLVCMNYGKIEDMDEKSLEEIQVKIAKKSKYRIVKSVLIVGGVIAAVAVHYLYI